MCLSLKAYGDCYCREADAADMSTKEEEGVRDDANTDETTPAALWSADVILTRTMAWRAAAPRLAPGVPATSVANERAYDGAIARERPRISEAVRECKGGSL